MLLTSRSQQNIVANCDPQESGENSSQQDRVREMAPGRDADWHWRLLQLHGSSIPPTASILLLPSPFLIETILTPTFPTLMLYKSRGRHHSIYTLILGSNLLSSQVEGKTHIFPGTRLKPCARPALLLFTQIL